MMRHCIKFFLLSLFLYCDGQPSHEIDLYGKERLDKAKWYFYCYASTLKGYLHGNETIDPLKCEVKLNSINPINEDTSKLYFDLYYIDTLNLCSFKPYDLIGVMIIRDKLYLPIYRHIVFDAFKDDSTALQYMKEQEMILNGMIETDKHNISQWLRRKAKQD